MSVTKKGIIWEIVNSLWIIFSFMGLSFVSFLYIGTKAKTNKWKFMSLLYFIANFVLLIIGGMYTDHGSYLSNLTFMVWIISEIIGPIHAILSRKEYLLRREYILNNGIEEEELNRMREEIYNKYTGTKPNKIDESGKVNDYSSMIYNGEDDLDNQEDYYDENIVKNNKDILDKSKYVSYSNKNKGDLIDINTCDREELLKLPGMNEELVDKTISLREMLKGFNSVQEFIDMMHIDIRYSSEILSKASAGERHNKK